MKAIFYPDVQFRTLFIPHILREIYFDRIYDSVKGRTDQVILDLGANIGLVTDFLRRYARRVYAVEPASLAFEALAHNREFNGWDNVEAERCAIWTQNGAADLFLDHGNKTCNSLVRDTGKSERVSTYTLQTFLANHEIGTVDFCKMDIEGAEREVLRGEGFLSVKDRIRNLLVEFHDGREMETVDFLLGRGFKAKRLESSAVIYLFTQ